MGGNRKKENERHYSAFPMCRWHHSQFHSMSFSDFQEMYAIDLYRLQNKILAEWLMTQGGK